MKHWADGGETKLSNLVTLCRFHHRLVHEGGAEIRILDDDAFRFVKANGESFDSPAPPAGDVGTLIAMHESIRISPKTAITQWAGESLDLGLAVDVLMQRRRKNVPAGTS